MPNPPVHFEIPADDVARAKAFYERTFGWTIAPLPMPPGSEEYFGVTTKKKGEEGINGGLMKRKVHGQMFTNYIAVKSIDAIHEAIEANGGTVIMPKREIGPGMGWISGFKDPENNIIGLHEMPATAPKKAKKAVKKKRK